MKNLIGVILFFIFFLVGVFGIYIISHEAYHYFTVDGKAVGICFGNCVTMLDGRTMISGVYWSHINSNDAYLNKNEWHAILFGMFVTAFFVVALVLLNRNGILHGILQRIKWKEKETGLD